MPGPPEPENTEDVREALARLQERQRDTEQRLARVEKALRLKPARDSHSGSPRTAAFSPASARSRATFETRMGLTWINRIGVITLVLGVAFFFKYAVDNRWLTETARVSLGAAAGLSALGLAEWLRRRDQATFAQGVSGAGIAILYVSCYASFALYRLLPHSLAFVLMAAITAGAGALALRYGSPAMAALGLVGGFLTPVVLSTGEDRPWVLFSYALVLSSGAVALADARRWRLLETLAFAASQSLYWSWLLTFDARDALAANVFALIFYAVFASRPHRAVFAAAQALAPLELMVVSAPEAFPFLPLAVTVTAAGLAIADRRDWPEAAPIALASFWVAYGAAHFAIRERAGPLTLVSYLTVVFALFFAWLPWRILGWRAAARKWDLAIASVGAALYYGFSYTLLAPAYNRWTGIFTLSLAAAHLAAARALTPPATILYTGIGVCLLTMAAPVQFAGYRTTMAWALEGAALAWIGSRAVIASLAVFGLAVIRLVVSDAWLSPETVFWNARFLTFATAAAALWLAARWIASGRRALAPYVAGHAVMLAALILEVNSWIARTAPAPEVPNAQSAAASILSAACAAALVALGIAARSTVDRVLGLGLIGIVVLKLYVYDVWRIDRGIYRVAAFAGLGLFLLITSYLYSRHRGSIENWWRDLRSRS